MMYTTPIRVFFCIIVWGMLCRISVAQPIVFPEQILQEEIRQRLDLSNNSPTLFADGEELQEVEAVKAFYRKRLFTPAWVFRSDFKRVFWELTQQIRAAEQEGLNPDDYHAKKLQELSSFLQEKSFGKVTDSNKLNYLALEFLCTDAFIRLGAHMFVGKLNPQKVDEQWLTECTENSVQFDAYLEGALRTGLIADGLRALTSQHQAYKRLKKALSVYEAIRKQGGWSTLSFEGELVVGDSTPNVARLVQRLEITNDLPGDATHVYFDSAVYRAVKKFQRRHGLIAHGKVDAATRKALNVPVEERILQIKANMERWRWLPKQFSDRYIVSNIASFKTYVIEKGDTVLNLRSIVGKTYRQTPVFTSKMTYLVFHPFWTVPTGILTNDVLPSAKKDSTYLKNKGMKVIDNRTGKEVNPQSIDWQSARVGNFAYSIRQNPGAINALGRIKFIFPNKYDIYMHDTPSRNLFQRNERAYSSGCIRLEQVNQLAMYLLKDQRGWSEEKVTEAFQSQRTQTVYLENPIDVHILYITAFVSPEGEINFRKDIYDRDAPLMDALLTQ